MGMDKQDMRIRIGIIMTKIKNPMTITKQLPCLAEFISAYFKEATDQDIFKDFTEALFELFIHRNTEVQIIALKALEWGVKERRLSKEDIKRVKLYVYNLGSPVRKRQPQNKNAVAA